jgi:hypothetical protein
MFLVFFFLTLSFSGGFCLIHAHVTLSTYLLGPPVGMDWTDLGCPACSCVPQNRTLALSHSVQSAHLIFQPKKNKKK